MKLKHPEAKQTFAEILLNDVAEEAQPINFEFIDKVSLRKVHAIQGEEVNHQDAMLMVGGNNDKITNHKQ